MMGSGQIGPADMKCQCGFQFAGPGEFRNCAAFVTKEGKGGVVCPKCKTAYVDGKRVDLVWVDEKKDGEARDGEVSNS